MTLGEKLLILLLAVLITAVLATVITATVRNVRAHRRAKRVHAAINRIR